MKPQESWAASAPLQALLNQLSDAVLLLDRNGTLRFANGSALRLLACEPGTPLVGLQHLLGEPAIQWLQQTLSGASPPPSSIPNAQLTNGKQARLAWQLLDDQYGALTVLSPTATTPGPLNATTPPLQVIKGELAQQVLEVFWASPYPVTLQDAQFRFVDVNAAYLAFTGYQREQLIGRDTKELQPVQDHERIMADRARIHSEIGTQPPRLLERRIIAADGRERHFRFSRRMLQDEAGQVFYLAVLQDSTAEYTARARAARSARELDDWFDLSPVGMVLFDEAGLFVRTNPMFQTLLGSSHVELRQASPDLQHLMAWSDSAPDAALLRDGQLVVREGWSPPIDGKPRRVRATLRSYLTPGGQRRFMAVVEDRSVEEERDLAQMQIGALMDAAGVGLATFQESSGWVQPTWRQRDDGSPPGANAEAPFSSALQSINRDIVLPTSLPEYEKLQDALRQGQRTEVRYAINHPELGPRWLLTRVEPATLSSGKRSTAVVTLDITEQQQSDARNQELLRELSTILDSTTAGIAYIRGDTLVRCNRHFELMLRLTTDAGSSTQCIGGRSIHSLFGHNEQAQRIAADALQALAEGSLYETEIEVPVHNRQGRGTAWYSLSVRRTGQRGQVTEAIAVLSDITRLKTQQLELEQLARDRELMFSVSEVGLAFLRGERIQRANDALANLLGYTAEELVMLPMAQLFADAAEFGRHAKHELNALKQHGRWSGELPLKRRDGRLLWMQVSKRLVTEGDLEGGIIASYVNVDDRHRAEQAVALQAERTRAILDSVLVGIVTVGPAGIEWMNRSARRMFGGDLADFINAPISTVATSEADHPFLQTHYLNELVEGQAETFECRVKAHDGREFWVVGNVVATGREMAGRQLTYALLDIERRRQAEARIAQTQASLQRIIEAAPMAITLRDAKSLRVLQINETAARIVGRTPGEVIGLSLEDMHEASTAAAMRADMEAALSASEVTKREYTVTTSGEARLWDARFLPLSTRGPTATTPDVQHAPPDQLLLVATDVTEQRQAQQAKFDAAIAQREMLVKEVHHRIKNNLQGVAGLLQQIAQRKPEVAPAMAEVITQVQAIAHVYGLQVGADGPLRLASVLQAITGSVQRTFGHTIHLSIGTDDAPSGAPGLPPERWVLPEAESIPIALALNELLTNAIKHTIAPAGLARPEVGCQLLSGAAGVVIVITNHGQLHDGFDLSKVPGGVSGLGLVRSLLPRRSATLTLKSEGALVAARLSLMPPGVRLEPIHEEPHQRQSPG
jgi:PAS domain S-box-containing protein